MDDYFSDSPENRVVLDRLKGFKGNRAWAEKQYAAWLPHFSDNDFTAGQHLHTSSYEATLTTYTSSLTQEQYEANIIRNVQYGYALCGLAVPRIANLNHAAHLAAELEYRHAITQP